MHTGTILIEESELLTILKIQAELSINVVLLTSKPIRNLTTSRLTYDRTIHNLSMLLVLLSADDDVVHARCIQIQNQRLALEVQGIEILELHPSTLNLNCLFITSQTLRCSLNLGTLLREGGEALGGCHLENRCGVNNQSVGTERLAICVQINITILILDILIVSNHLDIILNFCQRLSVNNQQIVRVHTIGFQFLSIVIDRTILGIQIQNTERLTVCILQIAQLHSSTRLTSSLFTINQHMKLLTNSRCLTNHSHICKFLRFYQIYLSYLRYLFLRKYDKKLFFYKYPVLLS